MAIKLARFLLDNAAPKPINEQKEPYGIIVGCEYNLLVINTISDGDNLMGLVIQIRPLERDGNTLFYRIDLLYGDEITQCDYGGNPIK